MSKIISHVKLNNIVCWLSFNKFLFLPNSCLFFVLLAINIPFSPSEINQYLWVCLYEQKLSAFFICHFLFIYFYHLILINLFLSPGSASFVLISIFFFFKFQTFSNCTRQCWKALDTTHFPKYLAPPLFFWRSFLIWQLFSTSFILFS